MEAVFTYQQLAQCAAREVALRKNVYAKHGISADREREIAMMETIARILAALAADFPNAVRELADDSPDHRTGDE